MNYIFLKIISIMCYYFYQSSATTNGGLSHPVGGKPPDACGIKEVMVMYKTVLEILLWLLRFLHEILGLIKDIKRPRRPTED